MPNKISLIIFQKVNIIKFFLKKKLAVLIIYLKYSFIKFFINLKYKIKLNLFYLFILLKIIITNSVFYENSLRKFNRKKPEIIEVLFKILFLCDILIDFIKLIIYLKKLFWNFIISFKIFMRNLSSSTLIIFLKKFIQYLFKSLFFIIQLLKLIINLLNKNIFSPISLFLKKFGFKLARFILNSPYSFFFFIPIPPLIYVLWEQNLLEGCVKYVYYNSKFFIFCLKFFLEFMLVLSYLFIIKIIEVLLWIFF
jgi:hypothetical protein